LVLGAYPGRATTATVTVTNDLAVRVRVDPGAFRLPLVTVRVTVAVGV
jgi:hypothetical protein